MKKVYESISGIQGALAKFGISKESENQHQHYKFRGIDAVYNALAPLLYKHKLLILPKVLKREVTEKSTRNGGVMFYVVLFIDYTFISVEDGSEHIVSVIGEAMDSADKATNKAMSAAYKYACIQAFAIPTEGDNDADSHTPEIVREQLQTIDQWVDVLNRADNQEKLHELFGSAWMDHKNNEQGQTTLKEVYDLRKAFFEEKK